MKEKIKYLIIGILIGAVLTAGVFLIFKKDNSKFPPNGMPDMEQFEDMDFENGRPPRRKNESSETKTDDAENKAPEDTSAEVKTEQNG